MILPDVNLLVYAYNRDAPHHEAAKSWWESVLNGDEPVGLPWAVSLGFVRLMTHPKILVSPVSPGAALMHVRNWLQRPNVEVLDPGPRHLDVLERMFGSLGVAANLTTDAHLAALAVEHQCDLYSNDTDFARFPGLRWQNPL